MGFVSLGLLIGRKQEVRPRICLIRRQCRSEHGASRKIKIIGTFFQGRQNRGEPGLDQLEGIHRTKCILFGG
ncbi:hypothetical protein BIZ35_16135 [Heyndrickxia coagulans]|nr:hypothetical protein BIZ35_16135 [Heyndrickxia coagulans]